MTRGMRSLNPKDRRAQRRRNHIAIDLAKPKYRHKVIERYKLEDEDERRFRRYKEFDE